jgi:hypothetical protein
MELVGKMGFAGIGVFATGLQWHFAAAGRGFRPKNKQLAKSRDDGWVYTDRTDRAR